MFTAIKYGRSRSALFVLYLKITSCLGESIDFEMDTVIEPGNSDDKDQTSTS